MKKAALFVAALAVLFALRNVSLADTYQLDASDASGNSSFNAAGNWWDISTSAAGVAPANNLGNYVAQSLQLRTPTGSGPYTFGGGTLSLVDGGAINLKAASGTTLTMNNLIMDAGYFANGTGSTYTLAGAWTLTGNGGTVYNSNNNGGVINLTANVQSSGSGPLGLGGAVGGANGGTITFSGINTYTGPTYGLGGTLSLGSSTAFPATTTLYLGSAANNNSATPSNNNETVDLYGNNATIAALAVPTYTAASGTGSMVTMNVNGTSQSTSLTSNTTVYHFSSLPAGIQIGQAVSWTINSTTSYGYIQTIDSTLNDVTIAATTSPGSVTNQVFNFLSTSPTAANQLLTNSNASAAAVLTFNGGATPSTYGGAISNGAGQIGLSVGSGTLVCTGNTNFSGSVSVLTGLLSLATAPASQQISGASGAVLNFNNTTPQTLSGLISGGGQLVQAGPGNLTLTNGNTYTGGTIVNGGTLTLNKGGQVGTIVGTLTINPGASVNLLDQDDLGWGGGTCVTTVSISGGLINNSNGNNNGYITNFNLTGGTMTSTGGGYYNFNNGGGYGITTNASASSSVITGGIDIRSSSPNMIFNVAAGSTPSGVDLLDQATIQDSGSTGGLTKSGAGTMVCTGNTTYSGSTSVLGGLLSLPMATNSQQYSVASGATLQFALANNSSPDVQNLTITGSGTILKTGTGTLNWSYYQGGASYTWAMSPGGLIDVEGGLLDAADWSTSATSWTSNYSSLKIAQGASFEGGQANIQVDGLSGGGTYYGGYYGGRSLTVGVNNASSTFSGLIQSDPNYGGSVVELIKTGTGTLTLTGSAPGISNGAYLSITGGSPTAPSTLNYSPTGSFSSIGTPGNAGYVDIAPNQYDVAVLNQTGGTLNCSNLYVGDNGTGTFSASGASVVNVGSGIIVAYRGPTANAGTGVMNVGGSAQINIENNQNLAMGYYYARVSTVNQTGGNVTFYSDTGSTTGGTGSLLFAGGQGTYNLNGGTLSLPTVGWLSAGGGAGGGNGTINLSGGVLQITSSAFTVPQTISNNGNPAVAVYVGAGGAMIDTHGNAVTFNAPLNHSGATDGGLTLADSLGSGTLTLTATSNYNGPTNINVGTLVLTGSAALNGTSVVNVNGGPLYLSGSASINSAGGVNIPRGQSATLSGNASLGNSPVLVNGSLNVSGLASPLNLQNSQTLSGTGTVTGAVTDTSGQITGGVGSTAGTLTFNSGALTLNGGAVLFDLTSSPTGVNSLINANGGLALSGKSLLNLQFSSFPAVTTTYTLFDYTGALSGGAQNITLGGNAGGRNLTANLSVSGQVQVTYTPGGVPANLTWASAGSPLWDVQTTQNWYNVGTSASDYFYNGDNVTFNDTAGVTAVSITGSVAPNSVVVNSNTNNYTFSGAGKITGGGSLRKSGSSILTILTNNDYTGGTTVNGGTLQLGDNVTSNAGNLAGSMTNNAVVALNRPDSFTTSVSMSGSGSLVQTGSGTSILTGTNTYTGGTSLIAGTLQPNSPSALPAGTVVTFANVGTPSLSLNNGNFVVGSFNGGAAGGTLSLNSATISASGAVTSSYSGAVTGAGGGVSALGGANVALCGPLSFSSGTCTVNNSLLTFNGSVPTTETYSLVSSGTAAFNFSNTGALNMPGGAFTGLGTILKTGSGTVAFGYSSGGQVNVSLSPGSLVDVEQGELDGSSNYQGYWGNNYSSLYVQSGATFNSVEHGAQFDAVNGSGVLTGGFYGTPVTITVGVANGSGSFTGTVQNNDGAALTLVKSGTGTQYFGTATYTGSTIVNGGQLTLGSYPVSSAFAVVSGATVQIVQNTNISDIGTTTITGGGTIIKTGTGTILMGNYYQAGGQAYTWAMSQGGLLDIEAGELELNDWNGTANFSANQSSLHVAAGAVFDMNSQDNIYFDALTGGGTVQGGGYGYTRNLIIGVANGSGTFSGVLQPNAAGNALVLRKQGNGVETINGTVLMAQSTNNGNLLYVEGGSTASPSVLNFSPTSPSYIGAAGYTGGYIYIADRTGDVAILNQTAGSLNCGSLEVGDYGTGTYNASGSAVLNANQVQLAWNTGSGTMTVAGSATVNVTNNGSVIFGEYNNRPAAVTQSGGLVACYSDAGATLGGTGGLWFRGGNANYAYNLNGGTLSIPAITWLAPGGGAGGGNGAVNLNGGLLQITSNAFIIPQDTGDNGNPAVVLNVVDGGARIDTYGNSVTFNAPLNHSSTGAVDGGLTLADSLGTGTLILTTTNGYNGPTTVSSGTLQLGTGSYGQDGSIDLTSAAAISASAALVYNLAGSDTASYSISGSGALAMMGPGEVVLSGTNTYTGGTTVTDGMLVIGNAFSIDASSVGTNLSVGSDLSAFFGTVDPAAHIAATPAGAIAPVPEPGTLALLGAGIVAAVAAVRGRKKGSIRAAGR